MNTENDAPKADAMAGDQQPAPKPSTPATVRRAVALGKEMRKDPNASKADVARKMFETIADEPREVIVQAFVDGAGLTPKGAQTYFYNCRRRADKAAAAQS
jgi:hypothetical protein